MTPAWFPPLLTLKEHRGDWVAFMEAVYAVFTRDFMGERPAFMGKRVGLKQYPKQNGYEATFWHLISEGAVESEREPVLERCERIQWPKAVMDNCTSSDLKVWSEPRKGERRIHLFCESARYLFVVADRGDYVLPWTGYPVEHDNQVRKLLNRCRDFGPLQP